MSTSHASPTYKTYWVIWFILLALTVAMVFIGAKPILIGGMLVKASLITLVYMHLVHEKKNLIWTVMLGIFLTSAVLVVLMIPDGKAM
jgi:cytochrome c oxidase subunit IV